ncbi:MAG TPA: NAD(P)(+) transhydrogenase (Re/Si-specific) subunit beta, partial [Qipengyuania sp.]|nr:NAD(P)(+) transhydrogenase (Re/Si-specific) subunit beta [Qipengyuania sp.]
MHSFVIPAKARIQRGKSRRVGLWIPACAGMTMWGGMATAAAQPLVSPETLPVVVDAAHAVNPWVALAYLASGVLFILALRGLSSPATSRAGNRYGMIGMAIAVVTTLVTHVPVADTAGF